MIIRLASTAKEFEAVYWFRYAIYVDEMNRKQKYADQAAKRICHPLDSGSYVLAAWDGEELAGTLRCNFLRETDIGEYFEMYRNGYLPETMQSHTQITTRLMIHPRLRKGTPAVRLSRALMFGFHLAARGGRSRSFCRVHLQLLAPLTAVKREGFFREIFCQPNLNQNQNT